MSYYYQRGGQQFGPCTEQQMRQMLAQGQLVPHDAVWAEGLPNWTTAGALFGGAATASPPVPPPWGAASAASPQPIQVVVAQPSAQPKSRVAFVLLGLFLGTLGIHNFYAGYTGRAVVQLLITLLTGWLIVPLLIVALWCLVEVIAVHNDAQGLRMA